MKAEEFEWEGEEAASASTGLCLQSQHTEQCCREQVPQLCAIVTVSISEPQTPQPEVSWGPHGKPQMMPRSRNTGAHLGIGLMLVEVVGGR